MLTVNRGFFVTVRDCAVRLERCKCLIRKGMMCESRGGFVTCVQRYLYRLAVLRLVIW